MSDGGYVKLWRKSLYSPMWKNIHLWRFWEWCLLKAEYQPTTTLVKYKEVALQPGQFIFGRRMAHKETGLSEQTVKTCVRTLSTGENPSITIETTRTHSIVTVIKWDDYQKRKAEGNPQITSEPTSPQPTANPQPTTYNKEEEDKETTHTSPCANFDSSFSASYKFVLNAWREVSGTSSADANTKQGARELAQAMDAGDLAKEHIQDVIKNGRADTVLQNQGLRGIARNFAKYLPRERWNPEGVPRRLVEYVCNVCGNREVGFWARADNPTPYPCTSPRVCKGEMIPDTRT